ncbi:uncharacterized protein EI90DRAFT_3048454 [Cantharellus anzutake]|uniref:uncharacterized protein n=1 Tax=Cantharellus anzutake TaxID=1750568 RepID=UPI001904F247|nr:uncharacterized protein EI90DRAFT_3048454 [Cantharellus anzutake]KAF8335460.1 hypothetical protein EI90DRAFT_3048454 [Cantharellus anzutake]
MLCCTVHASIPIVRLVQLDAFPHVSTCSSLIDAKILGQPTWKDADQMCYHGIAQRAVAEPALVPNHKVCLLLRS